MPLRLLIFLLSLTLAPQLAQAREQYMSRLYIDIEQEATENVALSVSELEKKIDSLPDDFSRSSAEKFLISHYLAAKDYGKAADTLKEHLDKQSTSSADDYLLLAQLEYKRQRYVDSAAALDVALKRASKPVSPALLKSALTVYYRIGDYTRSANILKQLVESDFANAEYWQNWISLLLKSGKTSDALNVMALAWEMDIPFREQDILLFADLYSINRIPERGAQVLEEALKTGKLPAQGSTASKVYDRLFRLWLQAGQRDKAQLALEQAAKLGKDRELQLHLAQLYSEKEQWQAMQDMVLKACETPLPDALVSRANLLLGVSQLKLGDAESARRSFINATFFGGETDRANQWLRYMQAEPATEREKIGVAGPCYSEKSTSVWTASAPAKKTTAATAVDETPSEAPAGSSSTRPLTANDLTRLQGNANAVVETKMVGAQKLFLGSYTWSASEFESKVLPQAMRLGMTIVKGGGSIAGPMHFIYPEAPASADSIKVKMGFPVSGNPKSSAGFKLVNDKGFKCVWRNYRGPKDGIADAFAQLYLDAQLKGYTFTGENRQVIGNDNSPGSSTVSMELQIGVE